MGKSKKELQDQTATNLKVGANELNDDQLKESSGGFYLKDTYNGKTVYKVYNMCGRYVGTTENEKNAKAYTEKYSFWN